MQTLEWDSCFSEVNKVRLRARKGENIDELLNETPNLRRGWEYKATIISQERTGRRWDLWFIFMIFYLWFVFV